MHATSREAYAAAAGRLEAIPADAERLAAIADEVLAVAGLLRREIGLRRALADSARSGEERAGLLRTILGRQVGAEALDVLSTLVAGRWARASELLDATERLGVDALLANADQRGTLADVEDQLFRFAKIVQGDPQLAGVLSDPTAEVERRATLVRALLEGRADPVTVRLAEVSLAGFGGRSFDASLARLVELAAERRDRYVAYVTVAAPLTEEEERRLGARLSEMYRRDVSLKITVEPEVLGGMRVQVGHDLYDGTVARRLTETRTALAGR